VKATAAVPAENVIAAFDPVTYSPLILIVQTFAETAALPDPVFETERVHMRLLPLAVHEVTDALTSGEE
jgi:hypothetical protein